MVKRTKKLHPSFKLLGKAQKPAREWGMEAAGRREESRQDPGEEENVRLRHKPPEGPWAKSATYVTRVSSISILPAHRAGEGRALVHSRGGGCKCKGVRPAVGDKESQEK